MTRPEGPSATSRSSARARRRLAPASSRRHPRAPFAARRSRVAADCLGSSRSAPGAPWLAARQTARPAAVNPARKTARPASA